MGALALNAEESGGRPRKVAGKAARTAALTVPSSSGGVELPEASRSMPDDRTPRRQSMPTRRQAPNASSFSMDDETPGASADRTECKSSIAQGQSLVSAAQGQSLLSAIR